MSDSSDGESGTGALPDTRAPRWLVAVGSSAGALEALGQMLGGLPEDLPAAYVIAQHRSPSDVGPLVELLARTMPCRSRPRSPTNRSWPAPCT